MIRLTLLILTTCLLFSCKILDKSFENVGKAVYSKTLPGICFSKVLIHTCVNISKYKNDSSINVVYIKNFKSVFYLSADTEIIELKDIIAVYQNNNLELKQIIRKDQSICFDDIAPLKYNFHILHNDTVLLKSSCIYGVDFENNFSDSIKNQSFVINGELILSN